ncbi:MAG: hypothetical protein KF858_15555 [Candidatus Sumerlaeia bacterium]|nr:hypothetical protein [Candidatus Sumerlaeia bacterium]
MNTHGPARTIALAAGTLMTLALFVGCALLVPEQQPVALPEDTVFDRAAAWDPPLTRWEEHYITRTERFRTENEMLHNARGAIVFVGDSLTEGFDLARWFPGEHALNRGIISDGTTGWLDRVRPRGLDSRLRASILDCHPRAVFLLIGTNDLPHADSFTMDHLIEAYTGILRTTRRAFPNALLVVQTLPPTGTAYARHEFMNPRIVEYNARLRALAAREGVALLDLHALLADERTMLPDALTGDGLHLRPEAYARWAKAAHALIPPRPDAGP